MPGGDSGGSWAARIKGKPLQEGEGLFHVVLWHLPLMFSFDWPSGLPCKTSVYYYFAMDGLGGLELENEESDDVGFYISVSRFPITI